MKREIPSRYPADATGGLRLGLILGLVTVLLPLLSGEVRGAEEWVYEVYTTKKDDPAMPDREVQFVASWAPRGERAGVLEVVWPDGMDDDGLARVGLRRQMTVHAMRGPGDEHYQLEAKEFSKFLTAILELFAAYLFVAPLGPDGQYLQTSLSTKVDHFSARLKPSPDRLVIVLRFDATVHLHVAGGASQNMRFDREYGLIGVPKHGARPGLTQTQTTIYRTQSDEEAHRIAESLDRGDGYILGVGDTDDGEWVSLTIVREVVDRIPSRDGTRLADEMNLATVATPWIPASFLPPQGVGRGSAREIFDHLNSKVEAHNQGTDPMHEESLRIINEVLSQFSTTVTERQDSAPTQAQPPLSGSQQPPASVQPGSQGTVPKDPADSAEDALNFFLDLMASEPGQSDRSGSEGIERVRKALRELESQRP